MRKEYRTLTDFLVREYKANNRRRGGNSVEGVLAITNATNTTQLRITSATTAQSEREKVVIWPLFY